MMTHRCCYITFNESWIVQHSTKQAKRIYHDINIMAYCIRPIYWIESSRQLPTPIKLTQKTKVVQSVGSDLKRWAGGGRSRCGAGYAPRCQRLLRFLRHKNCARAPPHNQTNATSAFYNSELSVS